MSAFVKCEMCNAEIQREGCIFAINKVVIDGKERYFCCEHHASEFQNTPES